MEFMAAASFILHNQEWIPVATCYDNLSMSNLFNKQYLPDTLPKGWKWLVRGGVVTGAGGLPTKSEGVLRIANWKFTRAGAVVPIDCTVIEIPRDVMLIVGSRMMRSDADGMDIAVDLPNFRVYIVKLHEVVRLDWLPKVLARIRREPINVLSQCQL